MESGEAAKLTTALLTERDRSVMLARLTSAAALVPMPELLVYFVDVLLLAHQDRDRLKLRVAHLLAAPFRRTSEQSSAGQLALFAKAVEVLTPEPSPPAGASSTEGAEVEPSSAPPTKASTDIPALLAETERQIREQVERELLERKAELARQRAVRAAARAAGASAEAGSWPKNLPIREVVLDVDPAEGAHVAEEADGAVFGLATSTEYDFIGQAVAAAGDVDASGTGDVLIGSPGASVAGAILVLGPWAGIYTPSDFSAAINAHRRSEGFGSALAGGGDLDGDGFDDIAVGAPTAAGSSTEMGASYVFLGGVGM